MKNKIYFVRHGQTVANEHSIISGTNETDLTILGIQQAKDIAYSLIEKKGKINRILSSPLKRATDTAAIISKIIDVPFFVDNRLIEQNFGKFQGQYKDQNCFLRSKTQFINSFEFGETTFKVVFRIYDLLYELSKEDDDYLLVSHNGIARVVNSFFEDMTNSEFVSFGLNNCEIREYTFINEH